MSKWVLGIIGGSGLYDLDGLEEARWETVESPWGKPSDALRRGMLNGIEVVFLPRHGRGHVLSPSGINYRANIDVLKRAGVTDILSVSAVGSLREAMAPGDFVIVEQFIDRTFAREKTFFENGCVAHVSMAHPVCERLAQLTAAAARSAGATVHENATFLIMEGPQFSSLAESKLYRSWGCDVIGMTNSPESKLAREAEIPYATLAMVTDYDCWHEEYEAVDVSSVVEVLQANAEKAKNTLRHLTKLLALKGERTPSPQGIETVLDHALITAPEKRSAKLVAKLDAVAGRVLNKG